MALHLQSCTLFQSISCGYADKSKLHETATQILKAIERGLAVPEKDWPVIPAKPDIPRGLGPVTDMLKVLLKMKSEGANVASKLLASSADIELIAAFGEDADVAAMHGWRRDVFGEGALRIRNGEQALIVKGQKVELVELS